MRTINITPDPGPRPPASAEAVICAPGAGLGHLVRASALALRLSERGIVSSIVTNSPFAKGLGRLTGCAIVRVPDQRWKDQAIECIAGLRPGLVVIDAFPFGLRGEWAGAEIKGARLVHVARRLKLDRYLDAVGIKWGPTRFDGVIAAEPLAPEHEARLAEDGIELFRLPGRIRLPESVPGPPVPARLAELLASGRLWLVVHSGPERELKALIARAREELGRDPLAVITARPVKGIDVECFEYFPAARLFPAAYRVVSGAGYNIMAEMGLFPDKRVVMPFSRKYDDQAVRAGERWSVGEDGGPAAAGYLASLLSSRVHVLPKNP